jgi:hypothetical protein
MRQWIRQNALAMAAVAGLMLAHALVSYLAIVQKSATVDEPSHAMQAYAGRWLGDYRVDASNPPLWLRWVALAMPQSILQVSTDSPAWPVLLNQPGDGWQWFSPILYRTPGNDPDAFLNRARLIMLPIALGVGLMIACWSWRLAGPVAAVTATTLWALDPNFLAHGPLVKNDVAIALCLTGVAMTAWGLGRRVTLWRVALLAAWCGAAVATKFTGLLVAPILAALLLARALSAAPWKALWGAVNHRRGKLALAGTIWLLSALGAWGVIWASYSFQFDSGPTPQDSIHLSAFVSYATRMEMLGRDPTHPPPRSAVLAQPPSLANRAALWAAEHRLLPQAWVAGFIYVRAFNQYRPGFLLGEIRTSGWWWYFPVAAVVKTPLASLLAAGLALTAGTISLAQRAMGRRRPLLPKLDGWSICCLLLPLGIFGVAAMCSRQNVGIRHVLPMGPPIFIVVGILAARLIERWTRVGIVMVSVVLVALAVETAAAFPDYLAFFNAAAGGERGGLRLLSDSNLDWGQDLKPLAAWRREHPDGLLLLDYLGTADPVYYLHSDYVPLVRALSRGPDWTQEPGYLAVSASHLQGLYVPPPIARMYARLNREQTPVAVIGGSIYVYQLPLQTQPH